MNQISNQNQFILSFPSIPDLRNSGFGDQDSTDPDAITYVDKDSIAGFGEYDYDYYYDEEEEETEQDPDEDTEPEPESEPESHTHESESSTAKTETKGMKFKN